MTVKSVPIVKELKLQFDIFVRQERLFKRCNTYGLLKYFVDERNIKINLANICFIVEIQQNLLDRLTGFVLNKIGAFYFIGVFFGKQFDLGKDVGNGRLRYILKISISFFVILLPG